MAHKVIGVVIMAMVIAQMAMGVIRPALDSPRRPAWNLVHFNAGRLAILLSWANVYIGAYVYRYSLKFPVSMGAWVVPVVVANVVAVVAHLLLLAWRPLDPPPAPPIKGGAEEGSEEGSVGGAGPKAGLEDGRAEGEEVPHGKGRGREKGKAGRHGGGGQQGPGGPAACVVVIGPAVSAMRQSSSGATGRTAVTLGTLPEECDMSEDDDDDDGDSHATSEGIEEEPGQGHQGHRACGQGAHGCSPVMERGGCSGPSTGELPLSSPAPAVIVHMAQADDVNERS